VGGKDRANTASRAGASSDSGSSVSRNVNGRGGATKTQTVGSVLTSKQGHGAVLQKVIPVRVVAEDGKSFTTLGLLDTGSSTTLLAKELAVHCS
jgi:hypothetical protein